eukprot:scaffold18119_cov133-Isochrysis_galbana.AAC.1
MNTERAAGCYRRTSPIALWPHRDARTPAAPPKPIPRVCSVSGRGSVVAFVANYHLNQSAQVSLTPHLLDDSGSMHVHLLTGKPGSKDVRLNGVLLRVAPDGSLPLFKARLVTGPVTMPPVSLVFLQPAAAPATATPMQGAMCASFL